MALLVSGFNPELSYCCQNSSVIFLVLKLEKGIVLHVLKSILGNLFWTKEESCSWKVLMAFCFDESFEGGIFPCNPYKNVHKFGQILNVLKICIHGMQKLPEVSHLTAVKVLSAVVVVCVQSAFLFLS